MSGGAFEMQVAILLGTLIGVAGAIWSVAGMGDAYAAIGRGYLDGSVEDEAAQPDELPMQEARQVLEARSRQRVRRGKPPLDVDAELRALLDRWPDTGSGS